MRYFVTYAYFAHGRQHQSSTFVDVDSPIVDDDTLLAAAGAVRAQSPAEHSTESRCDRVVYFRELTSSSALGQPAVTTTAMPDRRQWTDGHRTFVVTIPDPGGEAIPAYLSVAVNRLGGGIVEVAEDNPHTCIYDDEKEVRCLACDIKEAYGLF